MNTTSQTPGTLIAIEGIDGCGKSTLASSLSSSLVAQGREVLLTREPGGSMLGKEIRKILQTQSFPLCAKAEYLLFAADRAQHFNDIIFPALEKGNIVISDRLADSSLAYQGYGRSLDLENISSINKWAMEGRLADYVLYLKIDVEDALVRLQKRKETLTSFEKENLTFWQKVSDGFDTIFANRSNVFIIDARASQKDVFEQALKALKTVLLL